jgi:hypothetical protein
MSLHCARRRETAKTGALPEVDPGPWSGIETGGARDSREAICGCVIWGTHRWEITYRCMRSYWRRRSSTLYCSTKQEIVVKSSTEGELVAVSNAANQGLNSRQFLIAQGHKMGPVIMYQDNLGNLS